MTEFEEVHRNYRFIQERIELAARRAGRDPNGITLLAVSKRQPLSRMQALQGVYASAGREAVFGENYVQEAKAKRAELKAPFRMHLIGALQKNKAKDAVRLFDVIESVHSLGVAEAINTEAQKQGKIQTVMLQVNISKDPAKSGFLEEDLQQFIRLRLPQLTSVRCIGLMTITQLYEVPAQARADFIRMRALRDSIQAHMTETIPLELSMGMSDDFEVAIEEGATEVRIGTALFGDREG